MNILLADDHGLVRDTIASYLQTDTSISVVAVGDFAAAVERLQRDGPFDLVMLDYNMPGMNGLEGLARARAISQSPVAILSGTAGLAVANDALAAGAIGFLPKTIAARTLINAVRFMAAGERYIPLAFLSESQDRMPPLIADRLSGREFQVLNRLVQGHANKEIARELDLQEVTVKLHVKTLCRKLGARNRTQAAIIGKEAGLP